MRVPFLFLGTPYETLPKSFFFVVPPFEPGAGSAEAGSHALDSRFRGNDEEGGGNDGWENRK